MTQVEIEQLIEARIREQLGQFRLQGDNETGVHGSWPSFSLQSKRAHHPALFIPPGGDSSAAFGFNIITRKISGTWYAGIYHTSYLFESYDDANFAVTGLLTSNNPDSGDAGWFAVSDGDEPFLQTTLDVDSTSGVVSLSDASIQHTGFSNTFIHDGGSPPQAVSSNVKIGKIVTSGSAMVAINYFSGARVMQGLRVVAYQSDGSNPQNISTLYAGPW